MATIPASAPLDIAVDLDGTLFKTDTLVEGFFHALFHHPRDAAMALLAIRHGRVALKMAVRAHSISGVASFPVREDLVDWLRIEASRGRRLHLVTAADENVALAAADRFEFFDRVIATRDTVNLKGPAKCDALHRHFAEGWSYVGNSHADMPVFGGAQSVVLAGHHAGLEQRVSRAGIRIEASFPQRPAAAADWFQQLRLHQWSKNFLIFVPLILSGTFGQVAATLTVLAGFLLLGLCASGTYILNDLSDLQSDRAHATKRNRPLAAARIGLVPAFLVAAGLILGSLAAAMALRPEFALLLAIYAITTVTYSMALKRQAMFDVSILAGLYTLRLAIGASLAAVALSGWLAAFSLTFFLSLSLAKRTTEIVKYHGAKPNIPGRGYRKDDLILVQTFGVSSGMVALLLMILFLVFQATGGSAYVEPRWLMVTPMLTFLWLSRVWLLASRGELDDDPVVFAVRDRVSLVLGALMGVATLAAVIGPRL